VLLALLRLGVAFYSLSHECARSNVHCFPFLLLGVTASGVLLVLVLWTLLK
jgi:hypothetical protein